LIPGKAVEAVAYCNIDGLPEYSVLLLGVGNYLRVAAASQWSILTLPHKDHTYPVRCIGKIGFQNKFIRKKALLWIREFFYFIFFPDPALTLISDPDCL
jgi:hypothetical protein